jgi:hypothetical protein
MEPGGICARGKTDVCRYIFDVGVYDIATDLSCKVLVRETKNSMNNF